MIKVKRTIFNGYMSISELYDKIKEIFYVNGIFNIDAIKILSKDINNGYLYICVFYCGTNIVVKTKNDITYREFYKYVNRMAKLASYKIIDISDLVWMQ